MDWYKEAAAANVGVKKIGNGVYYSFGDNVEFRKLKTVHVDQIFDVAYKDPRHRSYNLPEDIEPDVLFRAINKVLGPIKPSPGKSLVYRIGNEQGGLDRRNAADIHGIITFIGSETFENMAVGEYLSVYEVEIGKQGEYEYLHRKRQPEPPDYTWRIGVFPDVWHRGDGIIVGNVRRGSPAAAAGFQEGDEIIAIGGTKLRKDGNMTQVRKRLMFAQPGDNITFSVRLKNGSTITRTVVMGAWTVSPPDEDFSSPAF